MTRMTARYLVEAVSRETGVPIEVLRGKARHGWIVDARKLAYHATIETGLCISQMGRYLNKDHSTICKMVAKYPPTHEQRRMIEAIKLTAEFVASEREREIRNVFATGVAP